MHSLGSIMLQEMINADGGDYKGRIIPCDKGHESEFMGYRDKELLTVLGEVKVRRAYYYDRKCNVGHCPKDNALDIEGSSFSPGVRRIMGRVGAYRPFGLGHEDIKEIAGFSVTAKEIERISNKLGQQAERFLKEQAETSSPENAILIKSVPKMYVCMDGTGVPMVKADVTGRQGKGENGQAKTREAKLGCIFTQTTIDKEGHPVRDEGSTSYTGAIETAEEFGKRIYSEAGRRGIDKAEMVCVIGDGAPWIWNIADEHLYGATQIIDLYHAREHYWNVARIVFGNNKKKLTHWTEQRRKELNKGKVGQVINAIKRVSPSTEVAKEICDKEIIYFEKNKERMRYDVFKRKGLFVGSGVLEAGCRTVIGQRLKQSGMHWSVKGANNIISLRCCILSNRWEDFWEYRACA
jgi:hypothetical protein